MTKSPNEIINKPFLSIFQFGGNLDFQDFRIKKFHNIEIFFNATNIAAKVVEKLHSGGENFETESILSRKQSRLVQNFFNSSFVALIWSHQRRKNCGSGSFPDSAIIK